MRSVCALDLERLVVARRQSAATSPRPGAAAPQGRGLRAQAAARRRRRAPRRRGRRRRSRGRRRRRRRAARGVAPPRATPTRRGRQSNARASRPARGSATKSRDEPPSACGRAAWARASAQLVQRDLVASLVSRFMRAQESSTSAAVSAGFSMCAKWPAPAITRSRGPEHRRAAGCATARAEPEAFGLVAPEREHRHREAAPRRRDHSRPPRPEAAGGVRIHRRTEAAFHLARPWTSSAASCEPRVLLAPARRQLVERQAGPELARATFVRRQSRNAATARHRALVATCPRPRSLRRQAETVHVHEPAHASQETARHLSRGRRRGCARRDARGGRGRGGRSRHRTCRRATVAVGPPESPWPRESSARRGSGRRQRREGVEAARVVVRSRA